jgi:hypothetical protein
MVSEVGLENLMLMLIVFTDRGLGKSGSCNMIFGHQRNGWTLCRLQSKR